MTFKVIQGQGQGHMRHRSGCTSATSANSSSV